MAESEMVGYRFHPTDQELIDHYLWNKMLGNDHLVQNAINEIDICRFDPWDLPPQSKIQSDDKLWYFFCARDSKYLSRKRASRTTENGYWKATGRDRKIKALGRNHEVIGTKKTLVFYKGRVPKGERTSWVMHEYLPSFVPPDVKAYVMCKLKNKGGGKTSGSPCDGDGPSCPPAADPENHAEVEAASEVNDQIEEILESVCDYGGLDDDLGAQGNEQEERISSFEYPNDFSFDYSGLQSQFDFNWNELDFGHQKELVNPMLAGQDESSFEESRNTVPHDQTPLALLAGAYGENSHDADAETIYSYWGTQEISSSVDGPTSSTECNRVLKQESSCNSESFNHQKLYLFSPQSHTKLNNIAPKECPEMPPLQGKFLQLEASRNKNRQTISSLADSSPYSEYHPAYSKCQKQFLMRESPVNSCTSNTRSGSKFVNCKIGNFQASLSYEIPQHRGTGMSLKSPTSRIVIICQLSPTLLPIGKISCIRSKKNVSLVHMLAPHNINRTYQTSTHSTVLHMDVRKDPYFRVKSCNHKHQETRILKHLPMVFPVGKISVNGPKHNLPSIQPLVNLRSLKRLLRKSGVCLHKPFRYSKYAHTHAEVQSLLNRSSTMRRKRAL